MLRMSPIETLHLVLGNLITSKRLRKPFPFDLGALGCFSMRFASTGGPKISCFSLRASLPGNVVVGCIIDVRVVEGVGRGRTVGRIVGLGVGITVGIMSIPPGMVIIMSVEGGGAGESGGGSSEGVRIGIVGSGPSGSVGADSVGTGSVGIGGISVISGGIGVIGSSSCWANFCSCTPG